MVDLSFLTLRNILLWLGAWSLVGFVVMAEDKGLAGSQKGKLHPQRISERTLHEVALIGGFPGIIAGAKVLRHKTSKPSFWLPVGASVVLWVVALGYLVLDGLIRAAI